MVTPCRKCVLAIICHKWMVKSLSLPMEWRPMISMMIIHVFPNHFSLAHNSDRLAGIQLWANCILQNMKRNFLPILFTEMITIYVAIKSAAPAWWDLANYCFVYLSCCSSMVAEIWRLIYCMLVPQTPFIPYPLRYCMSIIDVKIHRACLPPKPTYDS